MYTFKHCSQQRGLGLLMDEVQTGCGVTGKFWGHEHFNLSDTPDVVTFSKKMMTGGFYNKDAFRPDKVTSLFSSLAFNSFPLHNTVVTEFSSMQ